MNLSFKVGGVRVSVSSKGVRLGTKAGGISMSTRVVDFGTPKKVKKKVGKTEKATGKGGK